jgi:hypothetical protein
VGLWRRALSIGQPSYLPNQTSMTLSLAAVGCQSVPIIEAQRNVRGGGGGENQVWPAILKKVGGRGLFIYGKVGRYKQTFLAKTQESENRNPGALATTLRRSHG